MANHSLRKGFPQQCHGYCQHKTISNDAFIIEFMKFHWPTTSRFLTERQKPVGLGE